MKKLLFSSFVIVGLATSAFADLAQFVSVPFLNGWGLIAATNTTYNFNDTNVPYADLRTNLVYSLTNTYFVPYFNSKTATNTIVNNRNMATAAGGWWTNTMVTNTAIGGVAPAWHDVAVWPDANGDVLANLALVITVTGTNAACTNSLTLTFAGLGSAGNHITDRNVSQSAQPNEPDLISVENVVPGSATFPVLITPKGLTPATIRTNLPVAFLQGVGALRLVSIVTLSNAAPNLGGYIDSINLEGWKP